MRTARRRPVTLFSAAALAATLLAGCGASSADYEGSDAIAPDSDVAYSELGSEEMAGGAALDYAAEGQSVPMDEQVIRRGDASVTVDDPYTALTVLAEKVAEVGGNVSYSSQWTTGDHPRAEATVRVPADQLDALLAWLPDLGKVEQQSTSSEDVTLEVTDLRARIGALETSIDRLKALMSDAGTIADLIEAEGMLTQRQSELDSLNSMLTYYTDQVALSTLTVSLATSADAPGPSLSWGESWQSFLNSLLWLLNMLIYALPWLIVVGLGIVAWRLVRRSRKRGAIRSEHVIDLTSD